MSNTRINVQAGRIQNRDDFKRFLSQLRDGEYAITAIPLTKPQGIDQWRAYYFALRDIMFEEGETGLTKKEIHETVKKHVMPLLLVDEKNWAVPRELVQYSTKLLTEQGWENFVKEFKSFAQTIYNCYL